jgi:hypothetical protein
MTVAVLITSGVAAITSAYPSMQPVTVWIGVGVIMILLAGNLRGFVRRGPGWHSFRGGIYTFTSHDPDILDRSGLDLSASMFAPCSLGCPGTARQHAASAARRGYGQPHRTAGGGIYRHHLAKQLSEKNRTEQRILNPRVHRSSCRVPYGNSDDHCLCPVRCRTAQVHGAGIRQVHHQSTAVT